jgi:hypothetical protein
MTQTESLEQVVARCGWPTLVGADRRGLAQQLELYRPTWLVLWFEHPCDVPPQRLISWLRERGPRPQRVVLAYRLEPNSEAPFCAGPQTYFPMCSNVDSAIQEAMWPLLGRVRRRTDACRRNAGKPAGPKPSHVPRTEPTTVKVSNKHRVPIRTRTRSGQPSPIHDTTSKGEV